MVEGCAPMTTKIEAHERNIGDIFSDLYQSRFHLISGRTLGRRSRLANFSAIF
jgi:hypothetical protein